MHKNLLIAKPAAEPPWSITTEIRILLISLWRHRKSVRSYARPPLQTKGILYALKLMLLTGEFCLVPSPHYSARSMRFGSRGLPGVCLGYVTEMNRCRTGTKQGWNTRRCGSVYRGWHCITSGWSCYMIVCKGFVSRILESFIVKAWLRCM